MSIQQQLDGLFLEWKQAQQDEFGLDLFFPDGLMGSEGKYAQAKRKVLYVLSECHVLEGTAENVKDKFWLKEIVVDKRATTKHENAIVSRLAFMQGTLTGNKDLSAAAFMNLNKGGGTDKADWKKILEYVRNKQMAQFIWKEIDILDPAVIVWCSDFRIATRILGTGYPTPLINMWHPSYYYTNNEKYQAHFLEIIKSQGDMFI